MKLLRWSKQAANLVGGGLFLMLFTVFIVQIVARFTFQKPLPWTDEAAVILYVWVILWAAATMVPAREHVVFDLVWNSVGRRSRQVMAIAGNLLVGGLALAGIPATWDYVHFMQREGTPVLGLPLMWCLCEASFFMQIKSFPKDSSRVASSHTYSYTPSLGCMYAFFSSDGF